MKLRLSRLPERLPGQRWLRLSLHSGRAYAAS